VSLIVYTRPSDNGISVCNPTPWALDIMCNGGGLWNDRPRGFVDEMVRRKSCPILQKGKHVSEDIAWRFVRAMQYGGCTTAEALDIIREHDCTRGGDGTLHELMDYDDLPDRWFRDAWRRSSNGGPPSVELAAARLIQWQRIYEAVQQENKRRAWNLFGPRPIKLNKLEYQRAIKLARDDEELRRIWPDGLSLPPS
jgi:hypothetical protein